MRRKLQPKPDPFKFCTPLERACAELLAGAAEPLTVEQVHGAVKDAGGGVAGFGLWPIATVRDATSGRVAVVTVHPSSSSQTVRMLASSARTVWTLTA